ncbi:MAG: hypothetical protein HY240_00095 [Actinobacteria bacterium]|nr:hypothetical protein [Actinomycetota bacterium]
MEFCGHGMDRSWCYLCHLEGGGVDPRTAWGLDAEDGPVPWERRREPMTETQAGHVRFLCEEFGEPFDESLTEHEAGIVVRSFLEEPMSDRQRRTLRWLCEKSGAPMPEDLTYRQARSQIRKLVALRGLRSA